MFCMTFVLFTRPVIEPVGTVVDKRKSVVKLLATAVCCQWLVPASRRA